MAVTFSAGETLTAGKLQSAIPKERIASVASTANITLASTNTIVDTDAVVTITNTDSISRRYMARARLRFSMSSGTNGLYRPVVSDGAATNLGDTIVQVETNVTGGSGQVGGAQEYHFTLAAGASKTMAAAGDRIAGGSATDAALAGATLDVYDLGPA